MSPTKGSKGGKKEGNKIRIRPKQYKMIYLLHYFKGIGFTMKLMLKKNHGAGLQDLSISYLLCLKF